MSVPKSVVKFKGGGVEYTSNVERTQYLLSELIRAALRDVGRYVCRTFRRSYYAHFRRRSGRVGRFTQYWVRRKQAVPDLQVGIKMNAFYGLLEEFGGRNTPRLGLLRAAVQNNIATIIEIESQYLSGLEDEARALSMISEEEYQGGGDG